MMVPPDDGLRNVALHEAAHAVVDAVLTPPLFYQEVVLSASGGNTGYSIAAANRVRGASYDYSLPEHQQEAKRDILVLMAGPAASKRLDPDRDRRVDESDYERGGSRESAIGGGIPPKHNLRGGSRARG